MPKSGRAKVSLRDHLRSSAKRLRDSAKRGNEKLWPALQKFILDGEDEAEQLYDWVTWAPKLVRNKRQLSTALRFSLGKAWTQTEPQVQDELIDVLQRADTLIQKCEGHGARDGGSGCDSGAGAERGD